MPTSPRLACAAEPVISEKQIIDPLPVDTDALVREIVSQQYNGCAMPVFRPPSEGGRRIVTTRKVKLGEVVGRSKNQMNCGPPVNPEQEAMWEKVKTIVGEECEHDILWGALSSLCEDELPAGGFPLKSITKDLQDLICVHFIPENLTPTPTTVKLHTEFGLRCTPVKLERLVQLWNCNSLDHTHIENTCIVSLAFALMNHACMPSVDWDVQNDEVVLYATRNLDAGDELSVSYVEDFVLHKTTKLRQEHIIASGKEFTCGCARCCAPELSRHVACPVSGGLGSAKVDLGTLAADQIAHYAAKETILEELLDKFMEEACDDEGESDTEQPLEPPEPLFGDLEKLTPEDLDQIRKIGSSGQCLAPTGHWLAHRTYGFLKDLAWFQKACPTQILECLDQRAAFVRQTYATVAPNPPPILEHGLELLEAAELLLKAEGWPSEHTLEKRRAAAADRLQESISLLEPLRGSSSAHVRNAYKYLASCNVEAGTAKTGQKRSLEADEKTTELEAGKSKRVD